MRKTIFGVAAASVAALFCGLSSSVRAEQRNVVSFRQDKYNESFFFQHNYDYRLGAGMHFFHSKQHDLNFLTPLADHEKQDALFNRESLAYLINPPRTEPNMEYYAPYSERAIWQVLRTVSRAEQQHRRDWASPPEDAADPVCCRNRRGHRRPVA